MQKCRPVMRTDKLQIHNVKSYLRQCNWRTDVGAIAKLFATKYRELYTSVPYDKDDMQRIVDDVNDSIKGVSMNSDCIVHLQDVKSAVGRLKPHKNDGGSCLSTDNLINAGDDCFTHIALLLTSITVHGIAPDSFHVSTIVPIPK